MILEMVTCDQCDWTDPMRGSMVPASWISADGRHYCSTDCLLVARGVIA